MVCHFWAGKNIFLTGHTGFKGSCYRCGFAALGATCHRICTRTADQLPVSSKPRKSVKVCSPSSPTSAIRPCSPQQCKKARPEVVIHMAAQALVRHSYQQPVETYATNVMGTVNLRGGGTSNQQRACRGDRDQRTSVTRTRSGLGAIAKRGDGRLRPIQQQQKGCAELVTSAYRIPISTRPNTRNTA